MDNAAQIAAGLSPQTKEWLRAGVFGAAEWSVIDDLCFAGLATQWNGQGWLPWHDRCRAVAAELEKLDA